MKEYYVFITKEVVTLLTNPSEDDKEKATNLIINENIGELKNEKE